MPAKFHSDTIIVTSNLGASRLHEILGREAKQFLSPLSAVVTGASFANIKSTEIRAWISNYINDFMWDVIIYSRLYCQLHALLNRNTNIFKQANEIEYVLKMAAILFRAKYVI